MSQPQLAPDAPNAPAAWSGDTREGFLFALSAYFIWGFLPFYMKAVAHIPAIEVVAHRILWSVPIAGLVLVWLRRTGDIARAFRNPSTLAQVGLTASIITLNWGIYVWAIGAGRTLETALGYYINPLFSVFLAGVVLRERLSRGQVVAIALAVIAVAILTFHAGGLPWVSLGLTITWGFYALFKKTLPVGPAQGFFLEVLILSVPAGAYVLWLTAGGTGHFAATGSGDTGLLVIAGVVTAIPLILYANGAKLLRLSTIGIMQYIAPTMIFLIAVFAFDEPFDSVRGVAFLFIWAALAIYSWTLVRGRLAKSPVATTTGAE